MDLFLDITQEVCPMNSIKVKLKLKEMSESDCLNVLLKKGDALNSVPKIVKEHGFKILNIKQETEEHYLIIITK